MDITEGKVALQSGVETLGNAAGHARDGADRAVGRAIHGARRAGHEVGTLVQRRPVETALFSAGAACVVAGLVFWFAHRD